jgi:hypothetical protein
MRVVALKEQLLVEGGAAIDTPPSGAADVVAARTVIQLDGDVLCLIDEEHYDEVVGNRHLVATRAWLDGFATTVTDAVALLERTVVSVLAASIAMLTVLGGLAWGLAAALATAVGALLTTGIELLVGWAMDLLRRSDTSSAALARWTLRVVVVTGVCVAVIACAVLGRLRELALLVGLLVPGLAAWGAQAVLRRKLRLRFE